MQTIGSPRTLKLVLTSTGQPVRSWNASSSRWKRGLRSLVDGLEPGAVIDVGDGGDRRADHVDPLAQVGVVLP